MPPPGFIIDPTGYIKALVQQTPMLAVMIANETAETLELSNGVSIEVHTSSYKSVRGRTLVCCEVKALVARPGGPSTGPANPLEAVGPAKRSQVRRLARAWLAARHGRTARELRFDVVGVTLSPTGDALRVDHVENAF